MNNTKPLTSGNSKGFIMSICYAVYILLALILLGCETYYAESTLATAFSVSSLAAGCLIILVLTVVAIVAAAAGIFLTLVKKRSTSAISGTLLACQVIILAVSLTFEVYEGLGTFMVILNLLTVLFACGYSLMNALNSSARKKAGKKSSPVKTSVIFGLGAVSLAITLLLFIFPFCTFSSGDSSDIIPLGILFGESGTIEGLIIFAALFALTSADFVMFLSALEDSSGHDGVFAGKMQKVVAMSAFITGAYFVGSAVYCTLFKKTASVSPLAILPFLCMAVLAVCFAFNMRKVNVGLPDLHPRNTGARIEFFIYTLLLTLITVASSLTDILKVTTKEPYVSTVFTLNGFKVLSKISSAGDGFRFAAFVLLMVLSVTAGLLLCSLASLISKSRLFNKITLTSCIFSATACLLIGLMGKYYEIVQKINEQTILEYLNNFIGLSGYSLEYKVQSTSYYWFIAAMVVVLVVLIRRPYSRTLGQGFPEGVGGIPMSVPFAGSGELPPDQSRGFDPCPAFTELDFKAGIFANQAAEDSEFDFTSPSLQTIVQFVVNYARDSRLHLSYKEEDIAAFVAGLGASRLTILQGMSGTGKTSLPKIFTEALLGCCEIVEVESSWRDKNELLGYYNEFSKTFTPKKFTRALYKARINPEQLTFIVLDEMNLSRIEYYFSDFLSLMENEEDKREIRLLNVGLCRSENGTRVPYLGLSEGHTLKIPPNVWFIGTANRDESTFEISDKVYDRAHTMNFNTRAPRVLSYRDPIPQRRISAEEFERLLREAENSSRFDLESCTVIKEVEALLAPYNISFGNRVAGQMETFVRIYCACFPPSEQRQNEAVETILLSKVVSKLEYRSVEDKEALAAAFGRLKLEKCRNFVLRLNED